MSGEDKDTVVKNTETDRIYSRDEVEEMRGILEEETNLDLASMTYRGVVANYLARHRKG